jgi:hypothetical protein
MGARVLINGTRYNRSLCGGQDRKTNRRAASAATFSIFSAAQTLLDLLDHTFMAVSNFRQ